MFWLTCRERVLRFLRDEDGSAYTLSYMMVLPFVVIFMMLTAETAMVLLAKIGTTYAAFSAARTCVVWQPAGGDSVAKQKATQSAVQALTPFAYGMKTGAAPTGSNSEKEYLEVFRKAATTKASENYIRRKYQYARDSVNVTFSQVPKGGGQPWEYDVKVMVEYKYTFHVPFITRLFGSADGKLSIRSIATLPAEAPMNERQSLGISYASP